MKRLSFLLLAVLNATFQTGLHARPGMGTATEPGDTIYIDATTPMLNVTIDTLGIGAPLETINTLSAQSTTAASGTTGSSCIELDGYDPYAHLPQTPTGAALSRFGGYPVNYGMGVPEIKIPLYDMVVDDITVPIYLEYHASGIKLSDPYSPYGAGWTLHAEPAITRSVMGLPDESGCLRDGVEYKQGETDWKWIFQKRKDRMPDMFNYRLLDRSGSFHFDGQAHGDAITNPFDPIKIDYNVVTQAEPGYFTRFTVRDENGLVYDFDCINDKCNTIEVFTDSVDLEWKCNKVTSIKSGRSVSFDYSEIKEAYYHDNAYALIEYNADGNMPPSASNDLYLHHLPEYLAVQEYDCNSVTTLKALNFFRWNKQASSVQDGAITSMKDIVFPGFGNLSGIEMRNRLVCHIRSDKDVISFEYTTFADGTKALKSITVKSNGITIKKIDFYVTKIFPSYYTNRNNEEHSRLDSLRIENGGGLYRFEYYNLEAFPSRYSRSKDFWGYNNGASNESLIPHLGISLVNPLHPNQTYYVQIGSADRNPSLPHAQTGSLRKIFYPTGGWTEFEYGLHQYGYIYGLWGSTYRHYNYEGGGLRIERITDWAPEAEEPVVRNFQYSKGRCRHPVVRYYDSGVYTGNPQQYCYHFSDYYYYRKNDVNNRLLVHTKVAYVPANPFAEFVEKGGSPVVYDSVAEVRSDGSKSVYYYDWHGAYDQQESQTLEKSDYVNNRDSWFYGQPILQRDYAKEGDNYRLVHSLGYVYDNSIDDTHNLHTTVAYNYFDNLRLNGRPDGSSGEQPYDFPLNAYQPGFLNKLYSGACKLLETRDSVFDASGQAAVTVTSYQYTFNTDKTDPTLFCRQTTVTHSDGSTTTETTRYPTDVTLGGTAEQARQRLVGQHLLSTPLQRSTTRNGHSVAIADYVYTPGDTVPRLSALHVGKTAATSRERIVYSDYTAYGKPQYMVTDGTTRRVVLYSYLGEYPVAVIDGATYGEVSAAISGGGTYIASLCASASPGTADWAKLKALRSALPAALVTVYQYKYHVGLTGIDAPGVSPVTYDLDNHGRLLNTWQNGYLLEHNRYNYVNR